MSGSHQPDRRSEDRRSIYGALLLATFAVTRRPLSFDDLIRVVSDQGARLSDVADWLATARASGLICDVGFEEGPDGAPVGPRLFVLADTARATIRVDRRRSARRSGTA
jgi:hypothetical protein